MLTSLKFLQTFKRIGDGAWLCVSVLSLASVVMLNHGLVDQDPHAT